MYIWLIQPHTNHIDTKRLDVTLEEPTTIYAYKTRVDVNQDETIIQTKLV